MKKSMLVAFAVAFLTTATSMAGVVQSYRCNEKGEPAPGVANDPSKPKGIYSCTLWRYALTFDEQQMRAIKRATDELRFNLDKDDEKNPRITTMQVVDDKLIKAVDDFDKQVDKAIAFAQRNSGDMQEYAKYGMHLYDTAPSALIIYGGLEVSAGLGVSVAGSVMVGAVLVPQRIQVMELAKPHRIIADFYHVDTALIVFPAGNVGAGVGGGGNARVGLSLVWGDLTYASDIRGLLTGVSASFALGVGNNFKIQTLKRWSEPGAINNVIVSGAFETGLTATMDIHGSVGYAIDAQSFFKSIGGIGNAIGNKLGINDPVLPGGSIIPGSNLNPPAGVNINNPGSPSLPGGPTTPGNGGKSAINDPNFPVLQ